MTNQQTPILLSDEQIQRFIADGFIVINSNLEDALHARISEEVAYALEHEIPHPGDNIVPRVPALSEVCDSAAVQGALISLLGDQFSFLPHRFPHNSEPLNQTNIIEPFDGQPKMASGSISAATWHQDGHAFCGRTRWHRPRAANIFYFPHDTPLQMGPTRLLAGSHLYATLHDIKPEQAVMNVIPAGSVIVAHFDLGHAGSPNSSDRCRYMVKFVAVRTRPPESPSWDHKNEVWQTPIDLQTPNDFPIAWRSIWNWMRGAEPLDAIDVPTAGALPDFLSGLKSPSQQIRLTSLYGAATFGCAAIDSLIKVLLQTAGQDKHKLADPKNMANYGMSTNHLERFFIERQFTPEDAAVALGTMGATALSSLIELLQHSDPWIRLNAVYALGEMGPETVAPYIDDICNLLNDPEGCVIRATLDTLCALGTFSTETVRLLHGFLARTIPNWKDDDTRKLMLEQIRYLSSLALLAWVTNAGRTSAEVEAALIETLKDDNGYPPFIACLALERYGSIDGMRAAIYFLRVRCWDSSQNTRSALAGGWTQAHRRATLARLAANREA